MHNSQTCPQCQSCACHLNSGPRPSKYQLLMRLEVEGWFCNFGSTEPLHVDGDLRSHPAPKAACSTSARPVNTFRHSLAIRHACPYDLPPSDVAVQIQVRPDARTRLLLDWTSPHPGTREEVRRIALIAKIGLQLTISDRSFSLKCRGIDGMPGIPKPGCHTLPDPAALI
jgi:hypothetical protein